MKNFLLATILGALFLNISPLTIEANEATRQEYLDLIKRYPNLVEPQGAASKGEIEIVLDKDKMASIEKSTGRVVGVVAKDKYYRLIIKNSLFNIWEIPGIGCDGQFYK